MGGVQVTARPIITLEVTEVRCEPLQSITEEDAKAEGVEKAPSEMRVYPSPLAARIETYRAGYAVEWDRINGKKYPWASNPHVFAISFKRVP